MTIFVSIIGLETRRQVARGEWRDRTQALHDTLTIECEPQFGIGNGRLIVAHANELDAARLCPSRFNSGEGALGDRVVDPDRQVVCRQN